MTYIPHTITERDEMLRAIGARTLDDLFAHLPAEVKSSALKLPSGLNEMELSAEMRRRAKKNRSTSELICFLGAGAYDHFIPPAVDQLLSRGEIYTAYTPYQPEISQGILQIGYEYQTMMASLCGCDVANASLYDGATALVEGCQMALRQTERKRIVLDGAIHPHYLQTVKSLLQAQNAEIIIIAPQANEFRSDLRGLVAQIDEQTAAVCVGYPNFFGAVDSPQIAIDAAHKLGCLMIAVSNPFAFGILQPAGSLGADIVCGEAQSLGIPLQFGGPYLGYLVCKKEFVRRMPGRLIGRTVDSKGRQAFALTLQAREQHIRREKATSNICSNEALCAMQAHGYMSCLGHSGLRRAGELCAMKTDLLRRRLKSIVKTPDYPVFHEFVFETKKPAAQVLERLLAVGILGGLDLGRYDKARANQILVCVTEKRTTEEIEQYVSQILNVEKL